MSVEDRDELTTLGLSSVRANNTVPPVGALVDWNYRRWAKKLGYPMQKNRQTDLSNFPIERARLEISLPLLLTASLSVIGYGWLMDHKVSLAGPIIMLFTMGYSLIAGFQVSSPYPSLHHCCSWTFAFCAHRVLTCA